MSTQTDVSSTHLSAAGAITGVPARLKGFSVAPPTSVAATFSFRDGSATGPIKVQIDLPSNSNPNSFYVNIPGEGVRFTTSIYFTIDVGSVTGVTAFWG